MSDVVLQFLGGSRMIERQMSPYLLLGFLIAGILSAWIEPSWLERHLGGDGLGPIFTASLFGVPLPLCSCAVIPVGASLKRNGASRSATTAFLLSTPQTGVDSILITWSMLGPLLAIFRPLTALLTGIVGGTLVWAFAKEKPVLATSPFTQVDPGNKCCQGNDGCECESPQYSSPGRIHQILKHGFVTLPRDIGAALALGVLIAGVIAALIPEGSLATYLGSGVLSVLVLMAVGVPLYVCATASVPIAAGFIHLGVSPGAALAFLIAGPATNAASISMIWKILGRRTALLYLFTVAISALGCGLLFDWLAPRALEMIPQLVTVAHEHEGVGWLGHLSGVVLVIVLIVSYWTGRTKTNSDCACTT